MNKEGSERNPLSLRIPIIKADSETQTTSIIVPSSAQRESLRDNMEQGQNLRKRRNLSKNRGQARQREKTPDPGRNVPHEDTPTSEDEDARPKRSSREIEADSTYEEMKRLVQEKAQDKDPVYDLDTEEVLEARAFAANERRRRSISPFAIPEKDDVESKGSFIDPLNRLLSTTYTRTLKDEDTGRRSSLVIDAPRDRRNSITLLTPPPNSSPSPKDKKDFSYPMTIPTTPKKLEEMVYPDEPKDVKLDPQMRSASPSKKENNFTFDSKDDEQKTSKAKTPNPIDIPSPVSGEIKTKVIQVERTPSKKLTEENKPKVEIRQRIVRTPSRKTEVKPVINKQIKEPKEEVAPVKPPRSRSASRLGGKTSESEMSEDQGRNMLDSNFMGPRRRVTPTPRRFQRNRSPRANRSQSVNRTEDLQSTLSGTGISQTSKEIIALMQQARGRSLSIPKDDPRMPAEYKRNSKILATPNKTPTNLRQTRGISCPKTIQIISDKEILQGIPTKSKKKILEKSSRQSSGYVEASQSEYTSSCYSTSPSDNEHHFNLSERAAELTHKLNILSQEGQSKMDHNNILLSQDLQKNKHENSVLRRRKPIETKPLSTINKQQDEEIKIKKPATVRSSWKVIANWQQFCKERKADLKALKLLRNKCVCDVLLLIIMCGLGGMMFKTFEGTFENTFKCSTRNVKRDFIESLWRGSHHMREEEWKTMARRKLYEFEDQLHTAHEAGVTSYSGQRSWNFMNSFVYCLTLVSTIGYGHIAPKTTYGRVATIAYAIVGIPLFLIVLADFGKFFTRIIKFFWAFIRRFYYTRSCRKVRRTVPVQEVMKGLNIVYDVVRRPSQMFLEDELAAAKSGAAEGPPPLERKQSDAPPPLPPKPTFVVADDETEAGTATPPPSVYEIDDEFNLPISVAIVILVVYMIVGAVGYNIWESWSFLESFYFVFISMSTIGLGDLVPDHPMFMMASIIYLIFGLALTSMCINVVQVKLSDTFKQASAKIGATIGLKVADEDGSLVPITPPPIEIAPVHMPKRIEDIDNGKSVEADLNNR